MGQRQLRSAEDLGGCAKKFVPKCSLPSAHDKALQKSWLLTLLQRRFSFSCKCRHLSHLPTSPSSRRSSSCFPVPHPSSIPLSFPPLPKELEHPRVPNALCICSSSETHGRKHITALGAQLLYSLTMLCCHQTVLHNSVFTPSRQFLIRQTTEVKYNNLGNWDSEAKQL